MKNTPLKFLCGIFLFCCAPLTLGAVTATQSSFEGNHQSAEYFQQAVMDFADEYMSAVGEVLDDYIVSEPDAAKRVAAQSWRVRYTAAAMSIATARDPRTNLLDMVVFISAGKWAVNTYWIPKVFGKRAAALSEVYSRMDRRIWMIVAEVLSENQQSDLRRLIINWEQSHSRMHEVSTARLRNLEGVHLRSFDDGRAASGILGNVRLFLKRVNKSLLSGERIMFCLNHTPLILAQQSDLTIAQVGEAFPLAAVKPETIMSAATNFPAALQASIDKNTGTLSTLLPQIGNTLQSADSLAVTLNKSIQMLDENGRIADPAAILKEANQAMGHLDSSISGINQMISNNIPGGIQSDKITDQIEAQTTRLLDAAFHRILLLLGIIFAGTLGILILVKILFFTKAQEKPPTSTSAF